MSVFRTISNFIPFTGYPYEGAEDGCPLCGSHSATPLSRIDRRIKRLTTVICDDCGLLRTSPLPTESELEDYYRSTYRLDYQLAGNRPPRAHLNRSRRNARNRIEWLNPFLAKGKHLLDFGCGSGELLDEGKQAGLEVLGLEPGGTYAEFAQQEYGVTVIADTWATADLGDRKFDIITSYHVFEHLRDPVGALEFLVSHLADDGLLVLEVPNITPRPGGRRLFEELHFAHVLNFTPETLEALGRVCGLEPHPDYPSRSTHIGFRKAAGGKTRAATNPDFAQRLAGSFGDNSLMRHIFGFKWITDAFRRVWRELRDSIKPRK